MSTLKAAAAFMATHARVLDRRRFELLFGDGTAEQSLAALAAYRNEDGGYGHGLEPDLRSTTSQPGGALHAFEVFEDVAPTTTPHAAALCDWLESVSLADGGLPFALPIADSAGCAPFWVSADSGTSSLLITSAVVAVANRVARHDAATAGHPWLQRATRYCLDAIAQLHESPHALVLSHSLQLLDAVHDGEPDAPALLARLGGLVPDSGLVHVEGGLPDEMVRPLDMAPYPGRPVRHLFHADVIATELERLGSQQQEDGGWAVDFASYSPAAALEWRGHATVRAVSILLANRLA